MKYLEKSSVSKRGSKAKLLALAVFASVFLFGAAPQQAHAIEPKLLESKPIELSPMEKNEIKLEEVEIVLDKKEDVVQDIAGTVDLKKQEVSQVAQTKEQLATEVNNMKSEIEQLKQKIAEKKAREAEAARLAEIARNTAAQEPLQGYARTASVQRHYGSSAGNTYYAGQCTWHVKNLKPELPNSLGNADQWYWRAQAQGWPTGTVAQAGAAASRKVGMHVVYVMEVYGDGTMLVSEMNYNYTPYAQRTTIKNQADFYYIY